MTSPVSPAQPLAPCAKCRVIPRLHIPGAGTAEVRHECRIKGDNPQEAMRYWNPPPAPAGEVGELVAEAAALYETDITDLPAMERRVGAWFLMNWLRIRAALTAQAAALEEAEGRVSGNRELNLRNRLIAADAALRALGCRMGPDGRWEKPCDFIHDRDGNCGRAPRYRPAKFCDGSNFVPITAPAKGEGET